jgi:hypothetical protein
LYNRICGQGLIFAECNGHKSSLIRGKGRINSKRSNKRPCNERN